MFGWEHNPRSSLSPTDLKTLNLGLWVSDESPREADLNFVLDSGVDPQLHPTLNPEPYLSSILFGFTMVPIIEQDYVFLWGIVFYIRNNILLGLTTKQNATHLEV